MWNLTLTTLIATVIAALTANFVVPLVREFAHVLRAVDTPGGRKSHAGEIARLGGVAIVTGLVFGVGSAWLIQGAVPFEPVDLFATILGGGLVFLVGVVDDVVGISALKKLVIEVAAATLVVGMGWKFNVLGLPWLGDLQLGLWSGPVTVLWIVGVTNAINLLDGLDGLASGVVAIVAASFLVYALLQNNFFAVIVTSGMLGACLGFLPYNREPADIFMGDGGSLTLGFLLGVVSVHTALKAPAAVAILVPALALGVPLMDTILVMIVRFLERPKGRTFSRFLRMFHADRNHLHHLLESIVTQQRHAVRWIYAMVVISSGMALHVALTKKKELGLALIGVELVAVVLIRRVGMARRARTLARRQRQEILDHGGDAASSDSRSRQE